jgi:TonB-linked SusC/RagA family outer membrane protein
MKNYLSGAYSDQTKLLLKKMRTTCLLFFVGISSLFAANVNSQVAKVSITAQNASILTILENIEKQTDYLFVYDRSDIDINRKISISANNQSVAEVLSYIFNNTNVIYAKEGSNIMLMQKKSAVQQKIVTGTVTDSNTKEPIPGVNIIIEGSKTGTTSDINGKFSISVPNEEAVLVFSFIGYLTETVSVTNKSSIDLELVPDIQKLNEVVVTALGIKKETKSLSYNVQQISSDDFAKTKDVNVMSSLAGKVAGVTINSSSSGIGGSARVVMRGTKSISGNNNAMYVVDGIPLPNLSSGQPDDQYTGAGQSGDGIAGFNADDIESISILNGSAAAALYGSAAANGVVLITTKKGLANKTSLSFTNNTAFYSPFITPKFQNKYGSEEKTMYSWASKMSTPSTYDINDFFQTGYNTSNTLNFSTGNKNNQTYISLGSVDARGIIHNNNLERYNFSVRTTSALLNKKLNIDLSFMYSNVKEQNMLAQGQYANPLVPIYLFPRGDDITKYQYYERYDVDRNIMTQFWPLTENGLSIQNPYWITNRNLYINKKNRYLISASLSYKLTDWANISGRARIDKELVNSDKKMYASTLTVLSENSDKGAYIQGNGSTTQSYMDIMLNINKYFCGNNWNITASLGSSFLDLNHTSLTFGGGLLTIPNLFTVNNVDVSGKLTYKNDNYHDRTNSIFGTASLGYKGMFYLETSLRNDWISALAGTNHPSVLYPSIGASAILSDIFGLKSGALSYAKARISYSEVGNAPERFKAINTYSVKGGLSTFSYYPVRGLYPERTHSWEVGLNLSFFNNKVTLDATGYKSYTENQLFNPEVSSVTTYTSIYVNAGKVTNKGIELTLGIKQKLGPVNYKTSLLWSLNRNRIDKLLPEYTDPEIGVTVKLDEMDVYKLGGAKQRLTVGGAMGDLYVNTMRTDEHGKIWINSMNGALETQKNNYVYAGNTNPKYNLAWRNDFEWKGLNLSFMFTARVGGVGVSATQAVMDYYGVSETSANARDNGGVSVNGKTIDAQTWYQTIGANGVDYVGSMYVYSMTNVRLSELTIGYNVPIKKWIRGIDGLNISLVGHNLLMIYCKAPFDPESTASTGTYNQCMDYFMQPSLRSIGVSAKVSF